MAEARLNKTLHTQFWKEASYNIEHSKAGFKSSAVWPDGCYIDCSNFPTFNTENLPKTKTNLPNTKPTFKKWPKTFKILPRWRNFAKSGHTDLL